MEPKSAVQTEQNDGHLVPPSGGSSADLAIDFIANCKVWTEFRRWKNYLPYGARRLLARAALNVIRELPPELRLDAVGFESFEAAPGFWEVSDAPAC